MDDLRSGALKLESTPSREVAFMFLAADKVAEMLVSEFSWAIVRAPTDAAFVLPDMGITQYDPAPRVPGSGAAFMSSPNAETVIPVDPSFAIAVVPGPPVWGEGSIEARDVDEINLRAYAWSEAAVYGQSQRAVCDLRARAKRERQRLSAMRRRPARLWITEDQGEGGVMEFTGYSPEGTTTQQFFVDPRAFEREDE